MIDFKIFFSFKLIKKSLGFEKNKRGVLMRLILMKDHKNVQKREGEWVHHQKGVKINSMLKVVPKLQSYTKVNLSKFGTLECLTASLFALVLLFSLALNWIII